MFTSKTIRSAFTLAAAALAFPAVAGAIPTNGGGNEPPNPPPKAKFTMSPNPAVLGDGPVFVQAKKFPGNEAGPLRFGALVQFDGTGSTDEEGIAKYSWDLDGNGSFETAGADATPTHRYTTAGSYDIKLKVTDEGGKSSVLSKKLIVHHAPKAKIAATPNVALIGQQVALSAAGSTDDDAITKYEWDLDGDGVFETDTGTTASAMTSYTTLGTRSVKVRVRDTHGAYGTAATDVVVHRAPTAAFLFTPAMPVTDEQVTFDGSSSSDDDPVAKYEWDLDGDGVFELDTLAVPTATSTYAAPGTITVRLRVTDDHGVQDVIAHDVTVAPKPVDATSPLVTINPGSVKLRKGKVVLTVACPADEITCTGRLSLRSLLGARSSALGGAEFTAAGGQTAKVAIPLSKKTRRAVKRLRRLKARATAVATDAAGNTGTSRCKLVIRR
jgi:PKD repeat protein